MKKSNDIETQKFIDNIKILDSTKYQILSKLREVVFNNYPKVRERIMANYLRLSERPLRTPSAKIATVVVTGICFRSAPRT